LHNLRYIKKFVRDNPDILLIKADKENVTVAINLSIKNKMIKMFSDSNTYEVISKDTTKRLINKVCNLLTTWKNKEYIDLHT